MVSYSGPLRKICKNAMQHRVFLYFEALMRKSGNHVLKTHKDTQKGINECCSTKTISRYIKRFVGLGVLNMSHYETEKRVMGGKYPLKTYFYEINYDVLKSYGITKKHLYSYLRFKEGYASFRKGLQKGCKVVFDRSLQKKLSAPLLRKKEIRKSFIDSIVTFDIRKKEISKVTSKTDVFVDRDTKEFKKIYLEGREGRISMKEKGINRYNLTADMRNMAFEAGISPQRTRISFDRMVDHYKNRGYTSFDLQGAWRIWLKKEFKTKQNDYEHDRCKVALEQQDSVSVVSDLILKIKHPVFRLVCQKMVEKRGKEWYLGTLHYAALAGIEGGKITMYVSSYAIQDKILLCDRSLCECFAEILGVDRCRLILKVDADLILKVSKELKNELILMPKIKFSDVVTHETESSGKFEDDPRKRDQGPLLNRILDINIKSSFNGIKRAVAPPKAEMGRAELVSLERECAEKIKHTPSKTSLEKRRFDFIGKKFNDCISEFNYDQWEAGENA
jgi:hypothetical protein